MSKIEADMGFFDNPTIKELIEHLQPFLHLTLKITSIQYKNKKMIIILEDK